ncbi:serine threonine kinase [Fusarium mundagurra]|uniref:Serine threonine kinase n=1 Tax=Fusarium mundagurra TaxID=1567541 RepID=A0A8H5XSX7_9HYPO|nr:serine threonine kinase [Fusarium mundagurra]
MNRENWVESRLPAYRVHFVKLRRIVDDIYHGEYEVSFKDGVLVILAPRELNLEEKEAVVEGSRYKHIIKENNAVKATLTLRAKRLKRRWPQWRRPSSGQSSPESTTEEPDVPDTSQIPLFDSMTQVVPSMDRKAHATPEQVLVVVENVTTDEVGRTLQGLYATEVASGETSKVFGLETRLSLNGHLSDSKDVVRKCAVKRLHESTSPEQFWTEYESLKRLKSLNHPHLIETLSVFRSEMGTIQHFNFVFPLALSNLKRLFRDSYVSVSLRNRNIDSLWGQISGLSSAVAYLHDYAHMAHRDIKPSNILIYDDPSGKGLSLKLTDFGLSVDLSRARIWEQGSGARQLAWLYDSPEARNASPMTGSTEPSARIKIPSSSDLIANDIWKLGCVFTELLAYLVGGGSTSVEEFRNHITTTEDNISSDVFNDTRFDDGEQVKPQVLEFIDQMACKDYRAGMLQSVIKEMLAKSSLRPTIAHVCKKLADNNFPNISYNDGVRMVRFVPADRLARSRFDTLRLKIEEWTGRPIDWAPFRQPRPRLDAGGYMATWKWHGVDLSLALSHNEFNRYKPICFPVTTNNVPLLPLTRQGLKAQQAAKPSSSMQPINLGQSFQPSLGTNVLANTVPSTVQTPVDTKDIYWCIERNFTEPTEIYLSPIQNAETLDDEQLFRQVNKAIGSTEGWIRRLFSWKRCTAIDFVQFLVIWENKDQVNPIQKELPPPATPFYNHSVPLPHDVHMRAAGLQMVFGLRDPKKGRGETTIVDMLPKKRNPPPLSKTISEPGWGLHAKMGFSQRRFLAWLCLCIVLGGIFVVFWLAFINKTDLQNAFIPTFLFAALLTVAIGLLQVA